MIGNPERHRESKENAENRGERCDFDAAPKDEQIVGGPAERAEPEKTLQIQKRKIPIDAAVGTMLLPVKLFL